MKLEELLKSVLCKYIYFLPTFMSLYRLANSLVMMLYSAVVNSANVTRLSIVVQVAGKIQQVSH